MSCNRQQLNITCGTDVVLYDRLIFEGETFDPNLSVGITANLVSSFGKRTPLEVEVVDDELLITVPWIDGTLPGCYGLEVTGSCNSKKWSTYADSLIRYTKATRPGESEVTIESDTYDITQDVGYVYSGEGKVDDVRVNGESVLDGKVAKITMPTKTSDLINDSDFVVGDQMLNGYIGFSPKSNPSEVTPSDLVAVSGTVSYTFSNVTDGYYLWILAEDHMAMFHQGVNVPMYYLGTKDNLHVYRSEAMGIGSFFATFGIGNPNEPVDVVPILYTLTYSMQHITAEGPQTIMSTDQVTIFLTAGTGYSLPEEVTVSNALVVSYDDETGTLVIGSATGNVTVTATGVVEVYSVTNNLSSVTNSNDATTAAYSSAYNATLTPASGYEITALSVTMGGVPVSVSDNTIEIASVTGDIVITAVAETAGKVTVNVTSGGVAVSGALVTITIDDEEYTGTTNGNGTVLIVSAVGNGTIKVQKEGYVTYTDTIAVGTGSQTTSISISEIPTFTISGECNVDGVTLTIGTHAVEVENGVFSLSGVYAGIYAISCEGYSVSPSSVTVVDDDVDLDITLAELSSLSGTVTTELGDAVSGATVLLQVGGESYTTSTSSTGAYSFVDVPQGAATLSATTTSGTVTENVTLGAGANTKDIVTLIALPTGYTRYDVAHGTGAGYFSSSIKPTQNTKVVVRGRTDGQNQNQCIFHTRDSGGPVFGIKVLEDAVYGYFGTQVTSVIQNDGTTNKVYELSKDGLVIDGVTVATFNPEDFSINSAMIIGNGRGASGSINTGDMRFKGYIYWLKVYTDGVLTGYIVPCKNPSNAARMYDLKAKKEITRGGTIDVLNENE